MSDGGGDGGLDRILAGDLCSSPEEFVPSDWVSESITKEIFDWVDKRKYIFMEHFEILSTDTTRKNRMFFELIKSNFTSLQHAHT